MALRTALVSLYKEIGVEALFSSSRDAKILYAQRFVRLFAYGATTIILAIYLADLGFSDSKGGLFMTLTLVGDIAISLFLTIFADAVGRRLSLAVGSALMVAGGIVIALSDVYWQLLVASIFGVVSPSANEIDPFKAVEESTVSGLSSLQDRSTVFSWYILFGMAGQAAGTVSAGWAVQQLQQGRGWTAVEAYRLVFWAYAACGLCKLLLCFMMSSKCERGRPQTTRAAPTHQSEERRPLLGSQDRPHDSANPPKPEELAQPRTSIGRQMTTYLSRETWYILAQLCFLFALDSLASGLAPVSWITLYFTRKFGSGEGTLGSILFVSSMISSALNLVSSSMSKHIGLAKTMVLCHLPASVTLAVISVPANVVVALSLLVFRMSTKDMDTAPRQSFVAAVVLEGERTAVMGIINIVRTIMISVGPSITGALAGSDRFWIAFVIAGCLKIVYNLLIAVLFWNHQTKEEQELKISDAELEHEQDEEERDEEQARAVNPESDERGESQGRMGNGGL